jgi:hypothetical protein
MTLVESLLSNRIKAPGPHYPSETPSLFPLPATIFMGRHGLIRTLDPRIHSGTADEN